MIQMPRFPEWVFINDETLTRSAVSNLVVSEMETGVPKTRPKQSNPLFLTSMDCSIEFEKYSEWMSFVNNDLKYGASWFIMIDPFDGRRIKAKIMNPEEQMQKRGNLVFMKLNIMSYNDL